MATNWPSSAQLLGMVDELVHDAKFIQDDLLEPDETMTGTYAFDTLEGNRNVATHRTDGDGPGVQKMVVRTRTEVKLPNLREEKEIPAHLSALMDAPGGLTPERRQRLFERELKDLDLIFKRRHELDLFDLLLDSSITLSGDLSGVTYNFGRESAMQVTPGVDWDTPATATPLYDLRTWAQTFGRYSGGNKAVRVLMSTDGINALMETTEAAKFFSDQTKSQFFQEGIVPRAGGLEVIPVDHGYENSSGTWTRYLPANKAIILPAGVIGAKVNGPAVDTQAPDGLIGKFFKIYAEERRPVHYLLGTEKAMVGLTKADRILTATLW